ncbi:uncharacterized protein [Lepeophtheirus salmonis]|uniref:uncharacterized protein n=1 Tax=Lepeophtheirus salmonis TaxID=72036 RepID=UPI001AEA75A5|nr:neurofilament heavy polypeptide-like isoform X2 [Lepeophtheirus salmonis]
MSVTVILPRTHLILQRSSKDHQKKSGSPSVKEKNPTPNNINIKRSRSRRDVTPQKKVEVPNDFKSSCKAKVVRSRVDSKTPIKQSLKAKTDGNSKSSNSNRKAKVVTSRVCSKTPIKQSLKAKTNSNSNSSIANRKAKVVTSRVGSKTPIKQSSKAKTNRNSNSSITNRKKKLVTSRVGSKTPIKQSSKAKNNRNSNSSITNSKKKVVTSRVGSKTPIKQSSKAKTNRNSNSSPKKLEASPNNNILNELEKDTEDIQISLNNAKSLNSSSKKACKTPVKKVSNPPKLAPSPLKSIQNISLFKKPIYANAMKSWDESTDAKDVYDVLEDDGDESYRPIKRKRKKRAPTARKTKMTKIVKKTIKVPPQNKLHTSPPIKSPKPIKKLTIFEPFQTSAPCSIRSNNDVIDEAYYDNPSIEPCHFECEESNFDYEKSQNMNVNKSVRLSGFKKGLFSSSTPGRSNLITPSVPKTIKFAVDKISTPKFIKPMSIKEQIDHCFGFDDSDDDNSLFGGISPSNIINAQTLNVPPRMNESISPHVNRPKPTRLDVSIFKAPKIIPKFTRVVSTRRKVRREKSLNDTLLFNDLQDDEKKTSRVNKNIEKSLVKTDEDEHVSLDEEDAIGDENIAVTNLVNKNICRKRKRLSSENDHSPKRSKREEEDFLVWEINQSSEFSKIDEFDLSYI